MPDEYVGEEPVSDEHMEEEHVEVKQVHDTVLDLSKLNKLRKLTCLP